MPMTPTNSDTDLSKERIDLAMEVLRTNPKATNEEINAQQIEKFGTRANEVLFADARQALGIIARGRAGLLGQEKREWIRERIRGDPLTTNAAIHREVLAKFNVQTNYALFRVIRAELYAETGDKNFMAVTTLPGRKTQDLIEIAQARKKAGAWVQRTGRPSVGSAETKLKIAALKSIVNGRPNITFSEAQKAMRSKFGKGLARATMQESLRQFRQEAAQRINNPTIDPPTSQAAPAAMVVESSEPESSLTRSARALVKVMRQEGVEELTIKTDGTVRLVRVARETFTL